MDTNTNFSNSNTSIDMGIPPALDYPQEIIDQLPNPAIILHVTMMNCCCMKSITKRRLPSDFLIDKVSFANEQ